MEEKMDTVRENLLEELDKAKPLLDARKQGTFREKLEVFALRLEEIAEKARELAGGFEGWIVLNVVLKWF